MGKKTRTIVPPSLFITISIIIRLMLSYVYKNKDNYTHQLPSELLSSFDIADKISVDPFYTRQASTDFGHMIHHNPAAVFCPTSPNDIASLVKFSYNSSSPFTIAARGHGHSTKGQAMAPDGVVVEMAALSRHDGNNGIRIHCADTTGSGCFCDVDGGKLWIDVLLSSIEDGLAPVSWTDYLYLSVGGTLSNGGISGQTFLHGPQISNVLEMDVITGKGDLVTCSKSNNTELFNAVLGGLGQFGIITRARIPLKPAPKRVKWARMLYSNFSEFTRDQERLISATTNNNVDYVEGSLTLHKTSLSNWRSSFFSQADHLKIIDLVRSHGIIYCLEVVKYYDDQAVHSIDKDLQNIFMDLSYVGDMVYTKDVTFVEFLNRVRSGELNLKSKGMWDVPHPWLNLYVPKSSINDFNDVVFNKIIVQHQKNTSVGDIILVYPTFRSKWDVSTSAVVPEDDIFYCVGFLHSSGFHDWKTMDDQNNEILETCDRAGLKVKQYLPHYKTQQEWKRHFGPKWKTFQNRKAMFDPKAILSPGHRIFN